jgi:predicted MFS family arabinose efflux permease
MSPTSAIPTAADRQGWRVIAGLFVVLTISSGFGFYNMSVYMNVLSETRNFSVTSLSGAVSAFFVVGGIAGIGVARLLERVDVRWILITGACISGVALSGVALAESIGLIYLLFILFGIGNTGVSIVVSTTLVTRWFPGSNRSVALSIASTGLSMGGILITPTSAWLFERLGVETAMPGFGLVFAIVIVLVTLLFIRDSPPASAARTAEQIAGEWTYSEAARSRFFVLLTAGYVLCMASQVGGIAHLYNHVDGQAGYLVAATAVQALTAMSILSRIAGGFILTRIPIRWFALGNLAGQASGLALLAVADSPLKLLVAAGLFGASIGNLLMLHPLWLADAFGVGAYARLFSVSNAWTVLGVASGPLMMGILYDLTSYGVAYMVAVVVSLSALLLIAGAGARPVRL